MTALLDQLANYVTLVANGNRAIMVSAGFTASQQTVVATKQLGVVENFTVTPGKNSGEVTISVNPVPNARYYIFYCALAVENAFWEHYSDTVSSFTITGLESLKPYKFRIVPKGVKRQSVDTGEITRGVL